ncbi:hypothetical protein [Cytophaga aurantiaca]|uniref:hypothetical protein n=1 Tax=Cytophaga aurantiaca TaxID=29530 RepID=UPI000380AED9|nr:hypothetical protein [Cytophaga aurantiaca]
METPGIIMLLTALLGAFFVALKIYKVLDKKGNPAAIIIAAGSFIGTFILIYIAAAIVWVVFRDGFNRR